jgi:hypothetical protein
MVLLWAILFCAVELHAEPPIRRTWFHEQLAAPPEPSAFEQPRHQVGVAGVNYGDAVSTKVWALADLKFFEVQVMGGNRFFGQTSADGTALASALAPEYRNVGIEIGRYRINPHGVHGRISVAVMPFYPDGVSYWKFGLSTGMLATPDVPYEFRLSLAFLLSFNHSNDFGVVTAETWRNWYLGGKRVLQIGGFFTFGQAVRVADATVVHEYMLLSLGPSVVFKSSLGRLSAGIPLRVWVDKTGSGSFLSDFATPALSVGWQTFFF